MKSPDTLVPITNGSTSGNLQAVSIANNDNIKYTPNQDLSALRPSTSYPSQEVTSVDPLNDSSDTIIMDPLESQETHDNIKTTRIKEQLSNMGLPQSMFEVNKNKYFLAESTIDEDVDLLLFTDILDKSCSVTLDNLSQDDITFEKGLLKTSSPIHSPSTQTSMDTGDTETEKCDPTYGKPKPVKKSMLPRRAPSATRIAAQKCIRRTKGFTRTLPSIQQLKNTAPCSSKTAKDKTVTNKTTVSKDNKTSSGTTKGVVSDDSVPLIKLKAKSLTISHHGLKKHKNVPKGRHCQCSMCGEKFVSSTAYIAHYSDRHPPLPCANCSKVFSNPLSLQKH